MSVPTFAPLQAIDRPALLVWTRVLVFAMVCCVGMMPYLGAALVGGAFVLQAFWTARDHGDLWPRLRRAAITRGWIAVAAFVSYLVLRLLPLPLDVDALPGIAAAIIFTALVFGTFALFADQNDDVQRAIADAVLAAFVVTAVIHAIEVSTGFALRRLVWTWVPALRPRAGKFEIDAGVVRNVVIYIANPTSTILAALFWPVLLLAQKDKRPHIQRAVIYGGALLCAYAIARGDQATSKMALVAGTLTWLAIAVIPRATRPLLASIWIASNVLVLPVALYAYSHGWHSLPRNFSAQHRVVLWGVTAEKTLAHPILGIGTGKTPTFDDSTSPDVKTVPGTNLPIATNRHAHNVFLQTWYEGGALGVLLLILAGLPVVGWIAKAPRRSQALLGAAFSSAVLSASFSYSLLAAWFLASFAITALFCRFAVNGSDERSVDWSGA